MAKHHHATNGQNGTKPTNGQKPVAPHFVSRVSAFPLVKDSVTTVHTLVNNNSYGRYALDKATTTLDTVTKYASNTSPQYVQSYYETYVLPHLERADQYGCKSLDLLESKFPIVNQPTAEIVEVVRKPTVQVLDGVKTRIDTTIETVTIPATNAAITVNKRITPIVDNVEAIVDKYLPGEKTETVDNQAVRVYNLVNNVSTRVSTRVNDQIVKTKALIPQSREDLFKLTDINVLLEATTANLKVLNETLQQWIQVSAQAAQERIPPVVTQRIHDISVATHERLNELSAQITAQFEQLLAFAQSHKNVLPPYILHPLETLLKAAADEYQVLRAEYAKDGSSLQKAKNIGALLQNQLIPVLENVQSQVQRYSDVAKDKVVGDLKTRLEVFGVVKAQ